VNRRRFEIRLENDKVELEGRSENPHFKDRLEIDLETHNDNDRLFELEVRYRSETDDTAESELRFRFRLESILEFEDNSPADGGFNRGEEISTYTGPKTWNAWTQAVTSQGDVLTYSFTAQTVDGVITIVAHVTSGPTGTYDANGVKFDLAINNFPFTSPDSTGLAFITRLITEARVESDGDTSESSSSSSTAHAKRSDDSEDHLEIHDDNVLGRFGVLGRFVWVNALQASNGSVVVHAGTPTKGDGNYELIFWVNEHSDSYEWDPELRVDYTGSAGTLSSWLSYLF
jgi:hypothetical protein